MAFSGIVSAQEPIQQKSAGNLSQEAQAQHRGEAKEPPKLAGELFGVQVPLQNYLFVKGVLAVFGNRGGPLPKTSEEAERYAWDQLLLSYEAFRRGIVVDKEEVEREIDRMLQSDKLEIDRQKDRDAYERWAREKAGEPAELLENQIRHLLQIEKLRTVIMESIEPQVKDSEAYQEFLNEHNNLGVELVEFDAENNAGKFYREVKKNPKRWDEEKTKMPNNFKRPGSVSLEFLIDIWGFPKDAAYRMMSMGQGDVHPPAPIYRGYAVFKVLDKSAADKSLYKKQKKSYYDQVRRRKRYEELGRWFEDFKKMSNLKVYDIKREGGS